MKRIRKIIIDTDTGADDAWAIALGLCAEDLVRVEAITVVCGNFPLALCAKNAILAAEAAGTYMPPVYRGMERPLLTGKIFSAEAVHGEDGLGGMHLPDPDGKAEEKHAVTAMIDLVMESPGEIEIVTMGPLTNLAMASLLEPRFAANVKKAWILGGTAGAEGNLTPAAEYNVGTDPEAAQIVLTSGMKMTWVTWDTARGETEIAEEEVQELLRSGKPAGRFCALCTRDLAKYYARRYGRKTFGVIDSVVMMAALYPEIMETVGKAYCTIELSGGETRGHMAVDLSGQTGQEPNAEICTRIDALRYKERMFALLK